MRPVIPLLCLLAAGGLMTLPRWLPTVTLLVLVQALWHVGMALRQQFPAEVLAQAVAEHPGDVSVALAVTGPELHVEADLLGPARYVLLNHRVLTPVTGTNAVPAGEILFSTPHPFQSKLYQYNGLGAVERRIIDRSDQSIRLIDTQPDNL